MSFGTAIDAGLAELRAHAATRYGCRCEVRRLTGRNAQDEATGREIPTYVVEHADVPCRLPSPGRSASTSAGDVGGAQVAEQRREVHVSHNLPLLTAGWLIVVTGVDAMSNPDLVGQVFRVLDAAAADQVTARRIPVTGEGVPMEMVPA